MARKRGRRPPAGASASNTNPTADHDQLPGTAVAAAGAGASNESPTVRPPRPAEWEGISWGRKKDWDMDTAPHEFFENLPERLTQILNGPETENRGPWYWKSLAGFLRSKVPVISNGNDERPTRSARGKKKAEVVTRWAFEDEWKPHSMLGAGTFGRVGLWLKRDEEGGFVDQMAIKESPWESGLVWGLDNAIAREAVLHHHMNRSTVENFVQLRGFKHMMRTTPEQPIPAVGATTNNSRVWRLYTEFSPHGDLGRLMHRYRIWNAYFPELFLWHVFDSLAMTILTMSTHETDIDEFPQTRKNIYQNSHRLLHFDIKPQNIFLGYTEPFSDDSEKCVSSGLQSLDNNAKTLYPVIKLGDFGTSDLTHDTDTSNNPSAFWDLGTPLYKAPEMMHYGITFPEPPNGTPAYNMDALQTRNGKMRNFPKIVERILNAEIDLKFGQALNIWNVGKVMYDLVTMSRPWSYAKLSTRNYQKYKDWDYDAISDFQRKPFKQANANAHDERNGDLYSDELMDLIKQCMRPRMRDRITPEELKTRTQICLQSCLERQNDPVADASKVFFVENEINNMAAGGEVFVYCDGNVALDGVTIDLAQDDTEALMDANIDPDWEELNPLLKLKHPIKRDPNARSVWAQKLRDWRDKKAHVAPNRYWTNHCIVDDGKIIFNDPDTDEEGYDSPAPSTTSQSTSASETTDLLSDGGDDVGPNSGERSGQQGSSTLRPLENDGESSENSENSKGKGLQTPFRRTKKRRSNETSTESSSIGFETPPMKKHKSKIVPGATGSESDGAALTSSENSARSHPIPTTLEEGESESNTDKRPNPGLGDDARAGRAEDTEEVQEDTNPGLRRSRRAIGKPGRFRE